ncbi:MAG: hypothetical protein GC160_11115 [Acidobacteria bacterium]|nr:hypothetical protein [Acidobacteriota bacterium]
MEALKKGSIALLLVMMAATAAFAQIPSQTLGFVTCQATAVPPVVRAEGIAELVGDIVLTCQNVPPPNNAGDPSRNVIVTNVSVSLNVNVTNNINFGAGTNVSDAVLILNENNCTSPSPLGSTFVSCGAFDPNVQDPQFGTLAANNRLEWNRVAFPVPGSAINGTGDADCSDGGCYPFTTTLRITSMRGNASQLGVPETATFPSTQITAFVSITGPTTFSVTNNVLNVAIPILGLIVTPGTPLVGLQCIDTDGATAIKLNEGFATAFKTLGVPTYSPGNTQWESGYYAPGSNNGGGASQATRFLIRFFNIPQGVKISVPRFYTATTGSAGTATTGDQLEMGVVTGANSNGAGGLVSTAAGTVSVTLSGGFGYVVYEITDSNPFAVEAITVPISVSWVADTTNDLPAVGSGQVSATFAPLSTVTTASASEPEPRFIDTGGDPDTIVSIIRCTTTLLFPFVTNQAGFDTGMAISNTSEDWLGTDPQAGTCDIHYHGSTTGGGAAPAPQTSTVIAGGEQLIYTLSGGNPLQGIAGAPEFQGYIIAVCEFQYGHGFAFITDGFGGIPALAQGYLALVIPVTTSGRLAGVPADGTGIVSAPALHTFGEALNH